MAACNSSDVPAAQLYYGRLATESRDKLIGICVRNRITREQLETASGPCDADKLRDEAQNIEAEGRHADAIAKFEAVLACHADAHTTQLAFMASCNAGVVAKAAHFYALLDKDARSRTVVMCIRNGITRAQLDMTIGVLPWSRPQMPASLHVLSTPVTHIYIDGIDTGLSTPITGDQLKLAPGPHKVTMEIDHNRYSWPVTIEAKKTVTLSKDLR